MLKKMMMGIVVGFLLVGAVNLVAEESLAKKTRPAERLAFVDKQGVLHRQDSSKGPGCTDTSKDTDKFLTSPGHLRPKKNKNPHVQVTVDATKDRGEISRMLTGFNMSYYHDTDELWADGKIAGYLREVCAGVLRYPGGEETSFYHWEHPGVSGYKDAWAPPVKDKNAWNYIDKEAAAKNTNFMNIDEFIGWCRKIGAEPMIGVNIESGHKLNRIQDSLDETVRLVKYCMEKNYNVKYWYLDNESYHVEPMNYKRLAPDQYRTYIPMFSKAMKAVDPSIQIIVNWHPDPAHPDWATLLREVGEYFDIADVHFYWEWGRANWDSWLKQNPMTDKNPWREGPSYVEEIRRFHRKAKQMGYDIKLASLEWNIAPNKDVRHSVFQHALMQSEMLGEFIEGGLHMACLWPLSWHVGEGEFRSIVHQRYAWDTPDHWQNGDKFHIEQQSDWRTTPVFEVFKMYANSLGQRLVSSETSQSHVRPISALSTDGKSLWVYLLHKSSEGQTIRATLNIKGFTAASVKALSLTASALSSNDGQLKELTLKYSSEADLWECTLPPHSLTMVTMSR